MPANKTPNPNELDSNIVSLVAALNAFEGYDGTNPDELAQWLTQAREECYVSPDDVLEEEMDEETEEP